jgi:ATP synthase protein I
MAADADRRRRVARPAAIDDSAALGLGTGWAVFSYLISGMIAYGAIGWGIGRALHAGWLFPVGMIVGMAIAVSYVIYRYGKQGSVEQQLRGTKGDQGRRKGMTDDR